MGQRGTGGASAPVDRDSVSTPRSTPACRAAIRTRSCRSSSRQRAPACAAHRSTARPAARSAHDCWASILPLTPPLCDRCGDPAAVVARRRASRWPPVRAAVVLRVSSPARAIGIYDGALRAIIHALKYDGRRSLRGTSGALMRDARSGRARRRGRRGAGSASPIAPPRTRIQPGGRPRQAAADCRCFGRFGAYAPPRCRQSLPAARRHSNVRDAFALAVRAGRLNGSIAVLIDDVSTTGATLDACAQALRSAVCARGPRAYGSPSR